MCLQLPDDIPEGFQLHLKRTANRACFLRTVEDVAFTVVVSEENSWNTNGIEEQERDTVRVMCNDRFSKLVEAHVVTTAYSGCDRQ